MILNWLLFLWDSLKAELSKSEIDKNNLKHVKTDTNSSPIDDVGNGTIPQLHKRNFHAASCGELGK